jgi:hypothetical protein
MRGVREADAKKVAKPFMAGFWSFYISADVAGGLL